MTSKFGMLSRLVWHTQYSFPSRYKVRTFFWWLKRSLASIISRPQLLSYLSHHKAVISNELKITVIYSGYMYIWSSRDQGATSSCEEITRPEPFWTAKQRPTKLFYFVILQNKFSHKMFQRNVILSRWWTNMATRQQKVACRHPT